MDIEQITKERDAAIEASESLVAKIEKAMPFVAPDISSEVAAIKALKPKPGPFDKWCVLRDESGCGLGEVVAMTGKDKVDAERYADRDDQLRLVHLREVTPAPGWERWRPSGNCMDVGGGIILHVTESPSVLLHSIAGYHNEAMKQVTGTEGR